MATVELSDGDLQGVRELAVGDRLRIRLPENPTTGYRWQLSLADSGGLCLVNDGFEPGSASPLPGSSGHRVFELEARARGDVRVTAVNKRAWETTEQARHELRVHVR